MSSGSVQSVAYSPCGKWIASCGDYGDNTVRIWDAATGAAVGSPLSGHDGVVGSVCFSPDGKKIASSSGDKPVRIWDAATGAPVGSPLRGHTADNEQCTCRHYDADGDEDYKLNPQCPVKGDPTATPVAASQVQRGPATQGSDWVKPFKSWSVMEV